MSTYKFMAGLVDTVEGPEALPDFSDSTVDFLGLPVFKEDYLAQVNIFIDIVHHLPVLMWTQKGLCGDEEDYDPHLHRRIPNPTSYLDTMTHLLKASIGAGILAMPQATKGLGVIYSAITLASIGIFATYCMQLLITTQYKLCKRHRLGYMAYPKSMRCAITDGPPFLKWSGCFFYWFVESTLVIWQLGICTIFLIFVSENLKQICDYHGKPVSLRLLILFLLPPTIILNLVKDLKMLSPLSSISNIVTFFGIILVFFYLIEDDFDITPDKLRIKRLLDIPHFIGTALFALEAVGVVLALEYNMKNPKQFVGLTGLFNIGMAIIVSLYLIVGIFGYLKYGNNIKASITLNLPQNQKKAQAAKVLFAIAIFLSFPLQNFVVYTFMWRRVKKIWPNANFLPDYAIRVLCVVVPWLLAIALPHLGPFICLFGALCLSLLAMIFPAIMSICLNYGCLSGYGPIKYKLLRDLFILCMGVGILFSGVFSSILEILNH